MGLTDEEYQRIIKKTFSYQAAQFRATVLDLMLVVGEPIWDFIKRHPKLYWLWNKSEPLINAICWFVPFDLTKR